MRCSAWTQQRYGELPTAASSGEHRVRKNVLRTHPHAERSAQRLSRQGDEDKLIVAAQGVTDSHRISFDLVVIDDQPMGTGRGNHLDDSAIGIALPDPLHSDSHERPHLLLTA